LVGKRNNQKKGQIDMKKKKTQKEKACKHQWAPLLAKYKNQIIPVSAAKICLKCGLLKIGARTIKISRFRLDMGDLPIRNASEVIINSRLKVPVGTDLYD